MAPFAESCSGASVGVSVIIDFLGAVVFDPVGDEYFRHFLLLFLLFLNQANNRVCLGKAFRWKALPWNLSFWRRSAASLQGLPASRRGCAASNRKSPLNDSPFPIS